MRIAGSSKKYGTRDKNSVIDYEGKSLCHILFVVCSQAKILVENL